jgi:hypothetical protein
MQRQFADLSVHLLPQLGYLIQVEPGVVEVMQYPEGWELQVSLTRFRVLTRPYAFASSSTMTMENSTLRSEYRIQFITNSIKAFFQLKGDQNARAR